MTEVDVSRDGRQASQGFIARAYAPGDLDAVLAVFDSNTPEFFTAPERTAFEIFLGSLPGPYYVVEDHHRAVVACGGYALVPEEARADLCWGMVKRAHHRRGLGRLLTSYRVERISGDSRIQRVIMNTSQHTREFYERLGFSVERVTPDGFGPGLDRCDMVLDLRKPRSDHEATEST